jgi:hypothetical protein
VQRWALYVALVLVLWAAMERSAPERYWQTQATNML